MRIIIRNYLSGSFLLQQEPNVWDAIVILDSGLSHTDFVAEYARNHIYLRFDDVNREISGKRMPQLNDIQAALKFAKDSENLMVCCRAGQSRSAAVAFVIACKQLGSEAAVGLLNPKRHIPNAAIIDLGARVTEDQFLHQAFSDWRAANRGIILSDYVDEIEHEFDELEAEGATNRIIKR